LFCSGSDAILLGAETLRGLYPVETISTVGRICDLFGGVVVVGKVLVVLDLHTKTSPRNAILPNSASMSSAIMALVLKWKLTASSLFPLQLLGYHQIC
jgi:pyruvate kinase